MPASLPSFKDLLFARDVTSEAQCRDQFSWMQNQRRQSPCIIAGWLQASCLGGSYVVRTLPDSNHHYTPPDSANANRCSCSWAVYNLMQACAYCQGTDFSSAILGWNGWATNCTANFLSAPDPYPKSVAIPDSVAIPYYATLDPSTTWENAMFDPAAAEELASEDHPDLSESSRQAPPNHPNTAAIAGGVAGGVAVLLLAIFGTYFCFVRPRRRGNRCGNGNSDVADKSACYDYSNNHDGLSEVTKITASSPSSQAGLMNWLGGDAARPFGHGYSHSREQSQSQLSSAVSMSPLASVPPDPSLSSAMWVTSRPGAGTGGLGGLHAHSISDSSISPSLYSVPGAQGTVPGRPSRPGHIRNISGSTILSTTPSSILRTTPITTSNVGTPLHMPTVPENYHLDVDEPRVMARRNPPTYSEVPSPDERSVTMNVPPAARTSSPTRGGEGSSSGSTARPSVTSGSGQLRVANADGENGSVGAGVDSKAGVTGGRAVGGNGRSAANNEKGSS